MSNVTQILSAIEHGDPTAAKKLLPLVYEELRRLAASRLVHENPGQTLQATALVHEAFLRLVGTEAEATKWESRGHFFAAAAESMRRILVENARRKQRLKRGGDFVRREVEELPATQSEVLEDLVALDAALTKLAATDRVSADLIQLRYFAGLTVPEAARTLGISARTADRLWAYARAWLHREIQGSDPDQRES